MIFLDSVKPAACVRVDEGAETCSPLTDCTLTVLDTNSCGRTPPWFCGVLGCRGFGSLSRFSGCLKTSWDWTDSESHSMAAGWTGDTGKIRPCFWVFVLCIIFLNCIVTPFSEVTAYCTAKKKLNFLQAKQRIYLSNHCSCLDWKHSPKK